MRAVLRRLHSPDVDDLEGWVPEDGSCFGILVQALVGPLHGEGEESFDFTVCSPEWLAQQRGSRTIVFGRHYLFMFDYDFEKLLGAIESVVNKAEGKNWREVACRIGRYGSWEFEDYIPFHQPVAEEVEKENRDPLDKAVKTALGGIDLENLDQ